MDKFSHFKIMGLGLVLVLSLFPSLSSGSKIVHIDLVQPGACQSILNACQLTLGGIRECFDNRIEVSRPRALGPGVWLNQEIDSKNGVVRSTIRLNPKYQIHLQSDQLQFYAWGPAEEHEALGILQSDINEFDNFYRTLGFIVPPLTTVILGNKVRASTGTPSSPTTVLDVIFPFHEEVSTKTHSSEKISPSAIWDDEDPNKNYIVFPLAPLDLTNIDRSILMHERFHILTGRTFPRTKLHRINEAIDEALADFGSALFFNSPKIGNLRNIALRPDLTYQDFDGRGAHEISVLFSNVLWQMKEIIGTQAMAESFKPFVDTFTESFRNQIEEGSRSRKDEVKLESEKKEENAIYYFRLLRQFTNLLIKQVELQHGPLPTSKKNRILNSLMESKDLDLQMRQRSISQGQ